MSIFDWLFVGLMTSAILFLSFSFILLLLNQQLKKEMNHLKKKKRLKNSRKRKKWIRLTRKIEAKLKRRTATIVTMILLSILTAGTAYYMQYYQATHLGKQDSEAIVQGYYLIKEINGQLKELDSTDSKVKTGKNIKELSGRLSSYGTRLPSGRLTIEGQYLLKRMYKHMSELGSNLNKQEDDFSENKEKVAVFLEDLKKANEQQKKVFTYFKINEGALRAKK